MGCRATWRLNSQVPAMIITIVNVSMRVSPSVARYQYELTGRGCQGVQSTLMTGDEDDFTPFAELIPEGGIPMYGFLIVAYMDPEDGVVYDDWDRIGNVTLREALGTLESTKFRMAMQQFNVVRDEEN